MRMETEPRPGGMERISLMFCLEEPEPEDLWILEQLHQFPIPPKRTLEWERDGRRWKVYQYGQCVIGPALFAIEKHKRLVDKIRLLCSREIADFPGDRARVREVISRVALEFHKEARFTVDDRGALDLAVDEEGLRWCLVRGLKEA